MEKVSHKNEKVAEAKRRDLLLRWLTEPGETVKGRFRDPAVSKNK